MARVEGGVHARHVTESKGTVVKVWLDIKDGLNGNMPPSSRDLEDGIGLIFNQLSTSVKKK